MNTSRRGSSVGCVSRQAARAAATSGRFCSAAQSVFFKADANTLEVPVDRRLAHLNTTFPQAATQVLQSGAWRLFDEFADRGFVRRQLGLAATAKAAGLVAARRLKPLQNLDDKAHADFELRRRLMSRKPTCDSTHHPLTKVIGIRFSHLGRPPVRP